MKKRLPRGKVSTSSSPRFGSTDFSFWMRSQSATCSGKRLPALRIGQHAAHLVGEIGRERELAAGIDRHLGVEPGAVGDEALVLADALEAQHLAGEQEGVAGRQRLEEILLDLAEHRPAARLPPLCPSGRSER